MPRISVIIPVYNAEKYLAKCIESVVKQTIQDYEIIIINDGSTDNSKQIINEYIQKYPTIIKYFERENEGVSSARNFGIDKASGEYICFVDSDDFIESNLFEKLQPYINQNIDVIKYKCSKITEQNELIEKIDGPVFEQKNGEDAFANLFGTDYLIDVVWLFAIKKDYWINNNFEFPVNRYHEDWATIPYAILNANTVASLNIYGYNYMQSEKSITRNCDNDKIFKRAKDMLFHYDELCKKLDEKEFSKVAKENFKIYMTNCLVLRTEEIPNEFKKQYINELKQRKLYKNIKARNVKQFIKKILLRLSINLYLKFR